MTNLGGWWLGIAASAAALMSGCNAKVSDQCVAVDSLTRSLAAGNSAAGWRQKLEGCLGRWGYSLAASEGSVDDLAHATLGGCQDALASMVSAQQGEARQQQLAVDSYDAALSDARREALEKAAFYVAVGRVGKCKRPI